MFFILIMVDGFIGLMFGVEVLEDRGEVELEMVEVWWGNLILEGDLFIKLF